MAPFNLKTAQAQYPKPFDSMLKDKNDEHGTRAVTNPGNLDWLFKKDTHKNKDNTVHYEAQLDEVRTADTGNRNIEGKLNNDDKLYNDRRTDKAYASRVKAQDLVAEAWDQKKRKEFNEADGKTDKDTMFWDGFLGVDVSDAMKTKIVSNKQKSQLENHPDRFEGLDKTMPINESARQDDKTLTKEDKMYDLVSASVRDADAMLFHIYSSAALEKRDPNGKEQQAIDSINAGKARLLAFGNGAIKQQFIRQDKEGFKVLACHFGRTASKLEEEPVESFELMDSARRAYPDAIVLDESD